MNSHQHLATEATACAGGLGQRAGSGRTWDLLRVTHCIPRSPGVIREAPGRARATTPGGWPAGGQPPAADMVAQDTHRGMMLRHAWPTGGALVGNTCFLAAFLTWSVRRWVVAAGRGRRYLPLLRPVHRGACQPRVRPRGTAHHLGTGGAGHHRDPVWSAHSHLRAQRRARTDQARGRRRRHGPVPGAPDGASRCRGVAVGLPGDRLPGLQQDRTAAPGDHRCAQPVRTDPALPGSHRDRAAERRADRPPSR